MPSSRHGKDSRSALLDQFHHAALEVTQPQRHETAERAGTAGDGNPHHWLTTRALADNYVALCHNPCADIQRWLDIDKKPSSSFFPPLPSRDTAHVVRPISTSSVEVPRGLCREILRQMRGWVDAHIQRRITDRVHHGPRAGASGHAALRPLRAERQTTGKSLSRPIESRAGQVTIKRTSPASDAASHPAASCAGDLGSELAAVGSYYASRIAAVRASAKPADVAALVRAIQGERTLAMRALTSRPKTENPYRPHPAHVAALDEPSRPSTLH